MKSALERILAECGSPNLVSILAERLSPTDLQSLLLAVYAKRAERLKPSSVRERYRLDRFASPSTVDPRKLLEFDRLAFGVAEPEFDPIELSPVCPLGTVSSVAKVSQNNTVATSRNSEVTSDCTNVMALESAIRRKKDPSRAVRLCASHRLLRPQQFPDVPGYFAHFRVFALTTAGRDRGSNGFEVESLSSHIGCYLRLFTALSQSVSKIAAIRVSIAPFHIEFEEALRERVLDPLRREFSGIRFELDNSRLKGRGYYSSAAFQLFVTNIHGEEHFLVDGGFVDWTQKLLSNAKERLLISGMGTERFVAQF